MNCFVIVLDDGRPGNSGGFSSPAGILGNGKGGGCAVSYCSLSSLSSFMMENDLNVEAVEGEGDGGFRSKLLDSVIS